MAEEIEKTEVAKLKNNEENADPQVTEAPLEQKKLMFGQAAG